MNENDTGPTLQVARDPANELSARVRALQTLARQRDPRNIPGLHALWQRPRPVAEPQPENWDSAAAERVVDLHVILALHSSGDDSLLGEVAPRVAQAGRVLRGPDDELTNAVNVIRAIDRPEVVRHLIAWIAAADLRGVTNLVRVLQRLGLPAPASGGSVAGVPRLSAPVSFTVRHLREELEAIERLSAGSVLLSRGVREFIAANDFDRGEVRRTDTSLAEVLTQELDLLDLTYTVTPQSVVVCTFQEAAARWQTWQGGA